MLLHRQKERERSWAERERERDTRGAPPMSPEDTRSRQDMDMGGRGRQPPQEVGL